jgi:hypothetical protein
VERKDFVQNDGLNSRTVGCGEFIVHNIPCISGLGRFEDQNQRFGFRHRAMLDTSWDDAKFARSQCDFVIPEFNRHLAGVNEKQFIFVLVMMPREDTSELYEFEFLAIQ